MSNRSSTPAGWVWFSPWMLIGSVCILAGILLVLAFKNVHREREFMVRALLSQANLLARSLEASSRTGMMGRGWGRHQLQLLMEETAQQPDVAYVFLATSTGLVIAHSDPGQVGSYLPIVASKPGQKSFRFLQRDGRRSFEVTRSYEPWLRQRRGRMAESCPLSDCGDFGKDWLITVGLDTTPFDEASRQDLHHTILLFGLMFLVGAAGFVSVVWAHHYRSARRSLQNIEAFTSTIVNQMPVGLLATDRDGRIQRANDAARLVLRQSASLMDAIGDYPCFLPVAERLRKEEVVGELEIRCPTAGGGSIPLLMNAAVIRDAERRAVGHVFLFTDITDIKRLEEQLRRSERLASLGRLAAGIAHEIRNPLSSIKGFATILAGRIKEGDERGRKVADVMVQEVERLDRVVTELLDYARPTELNRSTLDCGELIRSTLRLVENDAVHRKVAVEVNIHPEDLTLEVDPDRFAQVLLNLYLNALQSMEKGGTLTIEVCVREKEAVVSVADTGAGIAPEHLPHIFDPYFTTKPQGVGLGLANVHKVVEAHGGEIKVSSTIGEGTRFVIRLPTGFSDKEMLG